MMIAEMCTPLGSKDLKDYNTIILPHADLVSSKMPKEVEVLFEVEELKTLYRKNRKTWQTQFVHTLRKAPIVLGLRKYTKD